MSPNEFGEVPKIIGCKIPLGTVCSRQLQSDGAIYDRPAINHSSCVWFAGVATLIGSHLTREPTASPVLTKWSMWELMLATNKWLPKLVAKFWLPNLVLYQTAKGRKSQPTCYRAKYLNVQQIGCTVHHMRLNKHETNRFEMCRSNYNA